MARSNQPNTAERALLEGVQRVAEMKGNIGYARELDERNELSIDSWNEVESWEHELSILRGHLMHISIRTGIPMPTLFESVKRIGLVAFFPRKFADA